MKKKLISSIALGLIGTNLFPIITGATENIDKPTESAIKEIDKEKKDDNSSNTENKDKNVSEDKKTESNETNKTTESSNKKISDKDWSKDFPKLVNPKADEIKTVNYSAETMAELKTLIDKTEKLEKTYGENKSEQYLEVFKEVFELHNKMKDKDRMLFDSNDQFNYIFYKLNYLAFTEYYDNAEVFNKFYQDLSDMAYLYAVEVYNKSPEGVFIHFLFNYLYDLTPENEAYFKDKKTNAVVQIAYSNIKFLGTGAGGRTNDVSDPSDDFKYEKPSETYNPNAPSVPKDFTPEDKDKELPPAPEVPNYENNGVEKSKSNPNGGKYKENTYVGKNDKCYLVTITKDLQGNVLGVEEKELSSAQGFFCGITTGLEFTSIPWNSSTKAFNGKKALDVWNSLAENELNELSNLTLHFSLNKNDTKPYYYDSGIRVSSEGKVTYTQLRDVLNQIAIKSGSYLIEDKSKLLFISEGKPLVIREKETEYTKEEVEELLNSFEKIGLLVKEKDDESVSADETIINNESLKHITVANKKIELKSTPKLESSILQLPVKEVGEALGYKVDITDKVATLTKDSTIIELEIGSKNVKVNGSEKITTTSSSIIDTVLFAEMNIVAQESGMKINFDKTKGTIEIK